MLSDVAVKKAKPEEKEYTLSDSGGLGLWVKPAGTKFWILRYTFDGKRRRVSLGPYPKVSLKQAREKRDEIHEQVAAGIDPAKEEVVPAVVPVQAAMTVADLAKEWMAFRQPRMSVARKGSANQCQAYLDKEILPAIGHMPVKDVRRGDIVKVIRGAEARAAMNVARKFRNWMHQMFGYALGLEYVDSNPASDISMVVQQEPPEKHHPHLGFKDLGQLMRDIKSYKGEYLVKKGLHLLIYTAVRTGELRAATQDQFDLDNALWTISASTVKQLQKDVRKLGDDVPDYLVPLSTHAIEAVRAIRDYVSDYDLLIPGRSNPRQSMSENTFNGALKRMGYSGKLTGHGIRGTFSTAMYELGYPSDWIEGQLSHTEGSKSKRAYNHARYVDQRRGMMQVWANLLEQLAQQETYDPQSIEGYRYAATVPNVR